MIYFLNPAIAMSFTEYRNRGLISNPEGKTFMRNVRRLLVIPALTAAMIITACGGSHYIQTGCPSCVNSKHFVYVANDGGNQSTVSALASDATTGVLTLITGSPYNTGSGSMALAKDPV